MQVITTPYSYRWKLSLWPKASNFCPMNDISGIVTYNLMASMLIVIIYDRCFPHIVNLAVQAVLSSITNMSYAKEDAEHFHIWQTSTRDVIALLRTLINKVLVSLYN